MSSFSTNQTTQGGRKLPNRWHTSDDESGTETDIDSDNEELYSDDGDEDDNNAANTTDTSGTAKAKRSTKHDQHHDLKELNSKDYELGSDSLLERYVKGEDYKQSSSFEIMMGGYITNKLDILLSS